MLPAVYTTLVAMISHNQYQELGTDWSWDRETITKDFPIGVIHFSGLLQVTPTSPVLLQRTDNEASDMDNRYVYAYKQVQSVVPTLKKMRE